MTEKTEDTVDVVVAGGGVAGLSAALTLARARRSVLVVDAGAPRNAPASGVHGFLTRDGISPLSLLESGAVEVTGYGGRIVRDRAVSARRDSGGFVVELADGTEVRARRLLVATGLVDAVPPIPGLESRWGRDVVHCPYCHGWEIRDQPIGVLSTGPRAVEQALLFRQWSDDVLLFHHTGPALSDRDRSQLAARGITVVAGEVTGLEITSDQLTGLRLATGRVVPRRALAVAPRFIASSPLLASLGITAAEHPAGEHFPADPTGKAAPGIWLAGNVTNLMANVVISAAEGATAAAAVNADLVIEDTTQAVSAFSATSESRLSEIVLGDRRHGLEALRG
jgi:thioredoxin reductase